MAIPKQFVVNERGEKIAVVISIEEYEKLLEDPEAVREYEEAKASGETPIPLDEAIARIERNRK
jgi:hypothetical protein